MKNIDLNLGGIVGALVCGGVAAAIIFSSIDATSSSRAPYKLVIVALIGGAFAGNFVWGLVFKRQK